MVHQFLEPLSNLREQHLLALEVAIVDRFMVLNLLGNAIKFTPEGGKVSLRASIKGEHLTISIKNTGIGISPQYHQQMFEMFEQGPPEISSLYQGSGLGLSLVKELAEMHGGDVWLKSVEGVGSTFAVVLLLGGPHGLTEPNQAIIERDKG